jgi:hypothetical protein
MPVPPTTFQTKNKLPLGPRPFPGLSPRRPGLGGERFGGSGRGKVIDNKRPKKIVITIFVLIYPGGKEWLNLFR